jgi:hypothetical protein
LAIVLSVFLPFSTSDFPSISSNFLQRLVKWVYFDRLLFIDHVD